MRSTRWIIWLALGLFAPQMWAEAHQCQGFSRHKSSKLRQCIYSNSSLANGARPQPMVCVTKTSFMQTNNQIEIERILNRLAYCRDYRTVFVDMLDVMICFLTLKDSAALCRNPLKDYKPDEQKQFLKLTQLVGDDMEGYNDAFGDLFMEYLSYGKNGQFFTPQPICDALAMMTMDKTIPDGKTVMDCACGSSRTLLAATKINRNLRFYGSDIDHTCVKMSVINMAYNSLISEIHWMNALSLEHYGSYSTHVDPITKLPFIITHPADKSISVMAVKEAAAQMPAHQIEQVKQQTLF